MWSTPHCFPALPLWPTGRAPRWPVKLVILNVLWISIHIVWLWLGVSLRRMNLAPAVQRGINVAMAIAMVAVVYLAARETVW